MPGRRRRGAGAAPRPVIVAVAAVALAACSGGDAGGSPALTVSAASSLRGPFRELAQRFEDDEGIAVALNFDASSSLAAQIVEGAPADVFASAAPEDVARLGAADLVDAPADLARNRLAIVTQEGNPQDVSGLADLADAEVVSLCDAAAPCGRYAASALTAAGVTIPESRTSRSPNVAAALRAVAQGDATAGIVYRSDALAAGDAVEVVAIEGPGADVTATYVIAVVTGASDPGAATAFVDLVRSDAGRAILEEHGFLAP